MLRLNALFRIALLQTPTNTMSYPNLAQSVKRTSIPHFYNVTVTVTESAGRVGRDTCSIIIVPKRNDRNDVEDKNYNVRNLEKKREGTKKDIKSKSGGGDNYLEYVGKGTKKKDGKINCGGVVDDDYLEYVDNVTDASLELYGITSLMLLWDNNLDPPRQG